MIDVGNFLPVSVGQMLPVQDVPPGSLMFNAGHSRPFIALVLPDKSRGLLEIGGDRSLSIWLDEQSEATAWTVPDWRIDVDPTSMVEGANASLMMGCAFRQSERSGLVGMFAGRIHESKLFSVDTQGETSSLKFGTKAFFSRWRLVVALGEGDVVIADDEGKARPRG